MSRVSLSLDEVLAFAEQHFPKAPEKLATFLKVKVRRSPLCCDGWCIETKAQSIIRINNSVAETRQHFTLAHEMGHLILGISSMIGETAHELRKAHNEEERQVNELAAELLLPAKIVKGLIKTLPITAKDITRIAKKSKTSEIFVARRLASLSNEIGLKASTVLFYNDDKFAWQWPESPEVKMVDKAAYTILTDCIVKKPNPARFQLKNSDVRVASLLKNPFSGKNTVFVQFVDEQHGNKKLDEELIRELQEIIFSDTDDLFKPSLAGCFGFVKPIISDMTLEKAVEYFNKTYTNDKERWNEEFRKRLASEEGQKYIRLRLKILQHS